MTVKNMDINFGTAVEKILDEMAILREKKGEGEETLNLINNTLDSAHDFVFTLIAEKHLVWQHEVMEEFAKPEGERDKEKMDTALYEMKNASEESLKYVDENDLERWRSRAYRMLGRACDYQGNYSEAIKYYENAIEFVQEDPEYKEGFPRQLEYKGFMAFSMVMSDDVEGGVKIARETYEAFDSSPEGEALLRLDYATWAIWKTGIAQRMVKALLDINSKVMSKDDMKKWLVDTQKSLIPPRGVDVWVDFGFRKDEIKNTLKLLK